MLVPRGGRRVSVKSVEKVEEAISLIQELQPGGVKLDENENG